MGSGKGGGVEMGSLNSFLYQLSHIHHFNKIVVLPRKGDRGSGREAAFFH